MIVWIKDNISTIIVCIILLLVIIAVITKMIKDKRKGKTSCGYGCDGCAMKNQCNKK
ncbi:MAG: FeoB-associated Cys-rich membrane protein [Clostridia bacterium]|nr:FeoB-associated Cys-rich membrane protein [Clostridia bacterium]